MDEVIENIVDKGDAGIGEEFIVREMVVKPLYMVSAMKEPVSMNNCVSVVVCLPSGVGRGNFSFRVVNEGAFLEVCVEWPTLLTTVLLLYRRRLMWGVAGVLEPYHPKILGFESALKELRRKFFRLRSIYYSDSSLVSSASWKCN